MLHKPVLALIGFLLLLSCSTVRVVPFSHLAAVDKEQTVRFFYPSAGGKVEAYLVRPRGNGSFPLVILLHGHSMRGRGAEQVIDMAQTVAKETCFASLAISLPGYGSTEVANGSIEEATRQVIIDGLSLAGQIPWIDKSKLMFYGVSRGAIVATAMISELKEVKAAVLYSGAYDLGRLYRETSSFWVRKLLNPNGDNNPRLANYLAGMSNWQTPTLILHGERDSLIPVNQSVLLRDRLTAAGIRNQLVVFPEHGHFLPRIRVRDQTVRFFKESVPPSC